MITNDNKQSKCGLRKDGIDQTGRSEKVERYRISVLSILLLAVDVRTNDNSLVPVEHSAMSSRILLPN